MVRRPIAAPMLVLCFLIGAAAMSTAAQEPGADGRPKDWVNALKPNGTPGPEMTLASGGKTRYAILLPAKPTSMEEIRICPSLKEVQHKEKGSIVKN